RRLHAKRRDVAQRDAVLSLLLRFKNQRPPAPARADEPDVELFVGPEHALIRHRGKRARGGGRGEEGATGLIHGRLRKGGISCACDNTAMGGGNLGKTV